MGNVIFYYILCICGIFACSCSQVLLKRSANENKKSLLLSILNWRVLIAYTIFFCSLFINITGFAHGVKVKDLPILESLGYLFVPVLSYIFFKEKLSQRGIISILLIILGIIVFYS